MSAGAQGGKPNGVPRVSLSELRGRVWINIAPGFFRQTWRVVGMGRKGDPSYLYLNLHSVVISHFSSPGWDDAYIRSMNELRASLSNLLGGPVRFRVTRQTSEFLKVPSHQ